MPRGPSLPPLRRLACFAALAALSLNGGCLVVNTVSMTGAVAVSAVKTTGGVAAAAVRTTGKVAVTVVRVGADVAVAGVGAASRLARSGEVVVFQPRTGLAWHMPLGPGARLTLAEAVGATGLRLARCTLVREGRSLAVREVRWAATELQSRDVVVAQG